MTMRTVSDADGFKQGLQPVLRRRLGSACGIITEIWRPGLPYTLHKPFRVHDLGQLVVDDVSGLTQGCRSRRINEARPQTAEGLSSFQDDEGIWDRHHEPEPSRPLRAQIWSVAPQRLCRRVTQPTKISGQEIFISAGEHDCPTNYHPSGFLGASKGARKAGKASRCSSLPKFMVGD